MRIISVNVAVPSPNPWKDGVEFTGIDKHPVNGPVAVRAAGPKPSGEVGLAGDRVGDVRNHGGSDQAVYAYALEDYQHFEKILGRELRNGTFGENLTIEGYDLSEACSGEQWIGPDGLVLEVTNPRIPCGTFRGWAGEAGWLKTFTREARPGAYLKVVAPGEVTAGIELEVGQGCPKICRESEIGAAVGTPGSLSTVRQPGNGLTMSKLFQAAMGNRELARELLRSPDLNKEMADYLRARFES